MIEHSRRSLLATATTAILLAPSGLVQASPASTKPLMRRIFSNWGGPPLPVWTHRPDGLGPNAPVLFIMHGVGRDADRYLSEWRAVADKHGFIAVCPEFSQAAFRGALNYNLGGVLDGQGNSRPRELWSFSAIAPMFDWLVSQEQLTTPTFDLFGHSAGAQFAHRFTAFARPEKLKRVIAANAGWYTLPDPEGAWPFGLKGAPGGPQVLANWLGADMTILLGTMDTDPNHASLNRDPPSMAQGPHRLARGVNFYASGRARAASLNVPFSWGIDYAPGIDHNNGGMASFAAARLFPLPAGGSSQQ